MPEICKYHNHDGQTLCDFVSLKDMCLMGRKKDFFT